MLPKELPQTPVAANLRERYAWKQVEAPKAWRPRMLGEELIGFFGGKTQRNGRFGQYEVVLVHVPLRGTFMLSGTRALQLIDAADLRAGWPIRIVWRGNVALPEKEGEEKKTMKNFEVYVAEGDPLNAEDLPRVIDG